MNFILADTQNIQSSKIEKTHKKHSSQISANISLKAFRPRPILESQVTLHKWEQKQKFNRKKIILDQILLDAKI
jgi:hypothetical protein